MGLVPTNDGLVCIFMAWPADEFATFRSDIEGNFLATLNAVPELADKMTTARRVERFYGSADLPNFFRKPYGPGWALVGDAGAVLDPFTGQGIGNAFRDAELLADALDLSFGGRKPMDAALAMYEQRRNAAAFPMYDMTVQLASFAPPPPANVALFKALAHNQPQLDRFFGVLTGSIPIPEYFSPLNMVRILGPVEFAKVALGRAA
jgi:2-polyprenyl-6-methoxyphenol hydroxylase-like FAD-dependent oxidoreductase